MNIIIKKKQLIYKGYKIRCCIGKAGLTNDKREGDLKTPKGLFKLGILYFRKDRINLLKSEIRQKEIKKSMGWCVDIKSKKYNKEIKYPFRYKSEKLFRADSQYNILIHIKYNNTPVVKKKGSAIFLHICAKNYMGTRGCVAIKKKDFLKIIPLIKKNTKILIK
jgi:L,D-peptidoglycan transpeptidase YkuD (ErfK/YbiS/YcfS/YnhG family)